MAYRAHVSGSEGSTSPNVDQRLELGGGRQSLVGHFVKPVAVSEEQEDLAQLANRTIEALDGFRVVNDEMIEHIHHEIGQHQQCRLGDVRNKEQEEILMAKLAE